MNIYDIIVADEITEAPNRTKSARVAKVNAKKAQAAATGVGEVIRIFENGDVQYKTKTGWTPKGPAASVAKEVFEGLGKPLSYLDKAKTLAKKTSSWITSRTFFSFVSAAQVLVVFDQFHTQKEAVVALWSEAYPDGHAFAMGSPYAQEQINKAVEPYRYSLYAAIAAIAVDLLVSMIRGGKALRVLRVIYAGVPPAGPWGLILKGLIFVATEGGLFALTWAIQKYGPDLFRHLARKELDEYFEGQEAEPINADPTAEPPAPTLDKQALLAKLRAELKSKQNGATPPAPGQRTPGNGNSTSAAPADPTKELKYDFGR